MVVFVNINQTYGPNRFSFFQAIFPFAHTTGSNPLVLNLKAKTRAKPRLSSAIKIFKGESLMLNLSFLENHDVATEELDDDASVVMGESTVSSWLTASLF